MRRPGAWRPGLLHTLSALAATFVPGPDADRRASLAAERIDRYLEPFQARGLRLAVRLVDSRAANLLLSGRPVRFTDLDAPGRERFLRDWAASRVALRRDGYHALRRLLTFVSYADPGSTSTRNPRLAEIGYRLTLEPVTTSPTALAVVDISSLDAATAREDPIDLEADVVIAGSGAGAGVVALELARAGRSVLVVESGPLVTEPDMPADELRGFDRLFLQGGLAATNDGSVQLLAGSAVGGGTLINWSTCLATPDGIRAEWATRNGLEGFDGPTFDEDLDALREQLGLVAPPWVPRKDTALLRGAAACDIEADQTLRNAVDCGDCDDGCTFGCRRGAKRSTMRVHLQEASRLGARILPDVTVDRVTIDDARVTGVEAHLTRGDGSRRRIRIRASQVVVAAGALRTPGILERSGVRHAALGKYLRIHPVAAIVARYADEIDMWHGPMQATRSLAFAPDSNRMPGGGGFTIESAPVHPGVLASAIPWTTAAEHAAVLRDARFFAPLIAITRDTRWGRVRPLRTGGARVDYSLAPGDVAQLRRSLVEMARIANGAGALYVVAPGATIDRWDREGGASAFAAFVGRLERFDFAPHRGAVFSAHQMGTARMGDDPSSHVCDPWGRVRQPVGGGAGSRTTRGLYVADSSLLPTAIGVNPMLTVMLLARRVARTVVAEASAGGG